MTSWRRYAAALVLALSPVWALPAMAQEIVGSPGLPLSGVGATPIVTGHNIGLSYTVQPGQSIQTALTDAVASGGEVFIQAGTYPITTTLLVSSNTHVRCELGAVITYADSGWTGYTVGGVHLAMVNYNFSPSAMNADTADPARDTNIEVDGCSFVAANRDFHNILFRQTDHVRVHNNFCKNMGDCTAMLATTDTDVYDNKFGIAVTGNTHSTTTIDGISSLTGVAVGDFVNGPGITDGTKVSAIPSSSSVTLSAAATTTVSGAAIGFGASHNACWDHWEGASAISVHNNNCTSYAYGTLVTGAATFGTRTLTAMNGAIYGNTYQMEGAFNTLAIWIQGLGAAGNGASRISVRDNTVTGDGVDANECWRVQGLSDNNKIVGNRCVSSGPTVEEASADSGGTPTNTLFTHNSFTAISLAAVSGAILTGGTNTRAIGERLVGGNYAYAIADSGTNDALLDNILDAGTSGTYSSTGTGATIRDVVNSINPQFQTLGAQVNAANTTTFAPVFSFALSTVGIYNCFGHLIGTAPAVGGVKLGLSAANGLGTGGTYFTAHNWNSATINANSAVNTFGNPFGQSANVFTDMDVAGYIYVNAPGTLNLNFAQNTANVTQSSIYAGSTMACVRTQ